MRGSPEQVDAPTYHAGEQPWIEWIVCTVLQPTFRRSISTWVSDRYRDSPLAPMLAIWGWLIGLVLDIAIPVAIIGGLSITLIGIPIVFILVYTATKTKCN